MKLPDYDLIERRCFQEINSAIKRSSPTQKSPRNSKLSIQNPLCNFYCRVHVSFDRLFYWLFNFHIIIFLFLISFIFFSCLLIDDSIQKKSEKRFLEKEKIIREWEWGFFSYFFSPNGISVTGCGPMCQWILDWFINIDWNRWENLNSLHFLVLIMEIHTHIFFQLDSIYIFQLEREK